MTSIHMNSSEPQTTASSLNGSLNQSQSSSVYDEAEQVRQRARLDELRRHHAESSSIHNRTQPIIDEQIHEDTLKYLQNNQLNGTKTKSQKPRAPKRQRTTANNSNNNNNNTTSANIAGVSPSGHNPTNIRATGLPNNLQHQVPKLEAQPKTQQHYQQATRQPQIIMQTGMQPMQQVSAPYSTHMQQTPMHSQPHQRPQQTQVNHQTYNGNYYPNQYQSPPANYPRQPNQQQHHQQQQQQQHMQPVIAQHAQHTQSTIDQSGHYANHQGYTGATNHQGYYQTQPVVTSTSSNGHLQNNVNHHHHHQHNNNNQHISYSSLPNDLDLNLQDGLECDIDSLINHEITVEGQLDFNNELLSKLDYHYQPNHQNDNNHHFYHQQHHHQHQQHQHHHQ